MDDSAAKALAELVAREGVALCDDPARLRAFLDDFCPDSHPETRLLVTAAQHSVPQEIVQAMTLGLPMVLRLADLRQRLVEKLLVTEEAAVWTVNSWAVAVGSPVSLPQTRAPRRSRTDPVQFPLGAPSPVPSATSAGPDSIAPVTGLPECEWGSYGDSDGRFRGPQAVLVRDDGTVCALDGFRMQLFDERGRYKGTLIPPAVAKVACPGYRAIAWASSGVWWVSHATGLEAITDRGDPVATVSGNFSALAAGGDRCFVSSMSTDQIRVTAPGATPALLTGGGRTDHRYEGLALAPSGELFATDALGHQVVSFGTKGEGLFKKAGRRIRRWGRFGTGEGEFRHPTGICLGPGGLLYLCDSGNDRVQVFSCDGRFIRQWGSSGRGPGQFNRPLGIAASLAGTIYVADSQNHRIQAFR